MSAVISAACESTGRGFQPWPLTCHPATSRSDWGMLHSSVTLAVAAKATPLPHMHPVLAARGSQPPILSSNWRQLPIIHKPLLSALQGCAGRNTSISLMKRPIRHQHTFCTQCQKCALAHMHTYTHTLFNHQPLQVWADALLFSHTSTLQHL